MLDFTISIISLAADVTVLTLGGALAVSAIKGWF